MITAEYWLTELEKRGFDFFAGVPCSFFSSVIQQLSSRPQDRYVIAPDEGAALAAAAGAALARKRSAVLIQNSGLGHLLNPLTSLNLIYRLGALIFVSGRGYRTADEPQHEIDGRAMHDVCAAVGVACMDMPDDPAAFVGALDKALTHLNQHQEPFVFFVPPKALEAKEAPHVPGGAYPLARLEALKVLMQHIAAQDFVVSTTGKISRELFMLNDRTRNFYMQGSMGHAAAIGLGIALSKPGARIVVLDGDGALLMHLGILSAVGHYRPKHFIHVVLDNEGYESTGGQATTSPTTDFCRMALSAGYAAAENAQGPEEIASCMEKFHAAAGPVFLRIKVNRASSAGVPRVTSRHKCADISTRFADELRASA